MDHDRGIQNAATPILKGPITKSRDQSSGILHIGVLKKHFDHFWEIHFEALEADGGQNAPETSGEVGLSWE